MIKLIYGNFKIPIIFCCLKFQKEIIPLFHDGMEFTVFLPSLKEA
jgi:hypothetical protein